MTERLEVVPDPRFAGVARRIIGFAHERLDSGSLFKSNVAPTERRADTFLTLLAQYEERGWISIDNGDDARSVLEAYELTLHVMSDHLGRDVLAHRLGHDAESIAGMRVELEVLKPLYDRLLWNPGRAPNQAAIDQDAIEGLKDRWPALTGGLSLAAGSESVPVAISPDRKLVIGVRNASTADNLAFLEKTIMDAVREVVPDIEGLRFRHSGQSREQQQTRGMRR
jgi:hypothetical protein